MTRDRYNMACGMIGLEPQRAEALWTHLGHGSEERIITGVTAPRPDAKNVAEFHWTDVDVTAWAKERLEELFMQFKISTGDAWLAVKRVETKGEGTVCNRKGKRIVAFEFDVTCKWTGSFAGHDVEGKLLMPYVSEDVEKEEEFQVTIEAKDRDESHTKKAVEYLEGQIPVVKQALQVFVSEIKNPNAKPEVDLQPRDKKKAFEAAQKDKDKGTR